MPPEQADDWRDAQTRTGCDQHEAASFSVVGLTILAHSDVRRIGERIGLLDLASGREEPLSRLEPAFAAPGESLQRPLADPYLSRRPLWFLPDPAGGVRLACRDSSNVVADGEPVRGERVFEEREIDRGVVLLVADRVALLLHRFRPVFEPGLPRYGLVGESEPLLEMRRQIRRVADLDVPVLLRGETGTASLRPETPQALSDLIDRLLEKEPVHRPQSAEEVAAALDGLTGSRASQSQASGGGVAVGGETTLVDGYRTHLPPALRARRDAHLSLETSWSRPRAVRRTALWLSLILLVVATAGYFLVWRAAPFDSYLQYRKGLEHLSHFDRDGNLDRAIEDFQRVLSGDDHHAAAHAALAKAYWVKLQTESKDPIWLERALPMVRRAVELDNDLAMAWVSLGLVNYSAGKLDEASQDFNQALRLEPLNADAYYGLGRVYTAQKKLPDAEAALRKAIGIRPDSMYYDELGGVYYQTGRMPEAIAAFRKSIELAPDLVYGYRNLGTVYYAQGDLAQAAAQFQKALQIRPEATLYGNLGNLYFAQGFYAQAAETFEKALAMPGGANSYLQWGNLGDACRWTPDKKDRAREAYLRGIQLIREELRKTPDDATLHSRLALYLAKRGDRDEALRELARLETTAGKDARAQYRMLVAYEVTGARDKALAALGQALRGGFPSEEIRMDPELLGLRADPRYHALVADLGASASW
ncbi:MAG: tetratricopeptide repeat protein [Thermoanaerobaculia bacterium]